MPKSKKDLIITLVMLALVVPSWLLWYWCLSTVWTWFMLPLGAPSISMAQAVGVSVVLGMFRGFVPDFKTPEQKAAEKAEPVSSMARRGAVGVIAPLIMVAIGYVVALIGGAL